VENGVEQGCQHVEVVLKDALEHIIQGDRQQRLLLELLKELVERAQLRGLLLSRNGAQERADFAPNAL